MRWYILRTLLHKECLRHAANRGGIAFVLLLIVAAMLLSFFRPGGGGPASGMMGGARLCYIDYHADGPFVDHLRANVPSEFKEHVRFRPLENAWRDAAGTIVYPQNTGAIQLRPSASGAGYRAWFWHPGSDPNTLAPYEVWFWKEVANFEQARAGTAPAVAESERSSLAGGLDPRSGVATALVLFGLFFVCVYLLPSLACEEHERGVLLAQALSPAAPREILAARFLFYPVVGMALAAILAGTYRPAVLASPFFWLALVVAVSGSMGVGLTVASIARTQRAASMGAMGYMLGVALVLFICQQNGIPGIPYLALEYHCPRMLHAALTDSVLWYHWLNLLAAALLAAGWAVLATVLFRRQGWQ
jgi:hypothetical protein